MKKTASLFLVSSLMAVDLFATDPAIDAARSYRQANGARIIADFVELLAIPNVASDLVNIERNAQHLQQQFEQRGVSIDLWRQEGVPPIVYGRRDAPGATRTIGIYVHYDGQPVVPDQWQHDPWQPTLYDAPIEAGGSAIDLPSPGETIDPEWYLYARGAGDDKAPIPAILTALDALAAAELSPNVNLVFLFEGEEEAGSPHLETYLRDHVSDLADVDLWLICDGPVHQSRRPQLVFGVRGITGFDIEVYGAHRYLHSGHYGNWAPNPAMALARLLASMKDEHGNVVIEGFYDDTLKPGEAEREALAALPNFEGQLLSELQLAPGSPEGNGQSLAERLLLPSLNIRGFESAAIGPGARNVIPTRAEASLDIRLVKNNDPERMLDVVERHIRQQGYHIVRHEPDAETRRAHSKIARVTRSGGYPATRTPLDHPAAQFAIRAAQRAAASAEQHKNPSDQLLLVPALGGSLPLYLFEGILKTPVVIVPIANHDDNQHAPNENLRLANLWYGIELMAALLTGEETAENHHSTRGSL